ncbi:helix-turn-helix transcriptional regulator [Saccharothrix variisporea]|uniref:DNA-binding XRE family transcriptional regulator n=1 Tax=Saccharothrix variisporea TaxID=543527 RepID=A0A495XCY8_9PSEU|nr:helix-turn-helix transcriptional regulator [Saccharothrix variisporea]RKT69398.1 DNA-binding XRE family transcriptional regulator [Saccharothrix variisporea]
MEKREHDEEPHSANARLRHALKAARDGAGLSQAELGAMVGYTRQYISLAEREGHNLPSRELVAAIDRALCTDGALVRLRDAARQEQLRGRSSSTASRSTPDTVEELLMSAAGESSEFLSWAESTNVGDLTIEQMHDDIRHIAHSYLKVPTLPLFARTKALRDRAFTILSGHQDPRHTRELYAAAGWSLTILAWISVDLGRADAAKDHARAAWMCAERADHNPLRAWVRATQHTAAFWQADYDVAARYATDGLNYVGTGTAELFLTSARALDLARAGDTQAAEDALHQAQRVADTAERAQDELAGPLTCTVDRAGSLWSDTELALGRADNALSLADRAVEQFEAAPEDERNRGSERMTRLQQVKAHLALGDLRSAEDALVPVLDTPSTQRVRPLVHRVTEVGTLAAQAGGMSDPTAGRIHAAVTDFRNDTVVRELSA